MGKKLIKKEVKPQPLALDIGRMNPFLSDLWEIYREYVRYNKGLLLKNDTPGDFLAEIEKALDYAKEPPVKKGDEQYDAPHYKHLRKYLEILNKF